MQNGTPTQPNHSTNGEPVAPTTSAAVYTAKKPTSFLANKFVIVATIGLLAGSFGIYKLVSSFATTTSASGFISNGREIIDAESGISSQLNYGYSFETASASPDGKLLAFKGRKASTNTPAVGIIDIATGKQFVPIPAIPNDSYALDLSDAATISWSQDGTRVHFVTVARSSGQWAGNRIISVSRTGQLLNVTKPSQSLDITNAAPQTGDRNNQLRYVHGGYSSQGYTSNAALCSVLLTTDVPSPTCSDLTGFMSQPSSAQISFSAAGFDLTRTDDMIYYYETANTSTVTSAGTSYSSTQTLWAYNLTAKTRSRVTTQAQGENLSGLVASFDRKFIFYYRSTSNYPYKDSDGIYSYNIATKSTKQLTKYTKDGIYSLWGAFVIPVASANTLPTVPITSTAQLAFAQAPTYSATTLTYNKPITATISLKNVSLKTFSGTISPKLIPISPTTGYSYKIGAPQAITIEPGDTKSVQVTATPIAYREPWDQSFYGIGLDYSETSTPSASRSLPAYPSGQLRAPIASAFAAISPLRVIDTRAGSGKYMAGQPLNANATYSFTTAALQPYGLPQNARQILANITATGATADTTIRVGCNNQPSSTLRVKAGQTRNNQTSLTMLPLGTGTDGMTCIYNSAGSVNVVIDVLGYYADGVSNLASIAPPTRLIDTRSGLGGGTIGARQTLTFAGGGITGTTSENLNVTVVSPTKGGFLTVYPVGAPRPAASSINFQPGEIITKQVTTKVGTSGTSTSAFSIYNSSDAPVNIIVDVASGQGPTGTLVYIPTPSYMAPRVFDSNTKGALGPNSTKDINVNISTSQPLPLATKAALVNITAFGNTSSTFITAYAQGGARPNTPTLYFTPSAGAATNTAIVPINPATGQITLYNSTGSSQVFVDVIGYYQTK